MLQQLILSIALYGKEFKALHYLTDLYPEPVKNKLAKVIWNSSKLLKVMSRSAFSFHFTSPAEVREFFQNSGFNHVEVIQPKIYFNETTDAPRLNPEEHLGDLVWMIQATLK